MDESLDRLVDQLLGVGGMRTIALLITEHGTTPERLIDRLLERQQDAAAADRVAEAALLEFLVAEVRRLRPAASPATREFVLTAAAGEENLLGAMVVLRDQRDLFGEDPVKMLHIVLAKMPLLGERARILGALGGVLWGDAEQRARARQVWASILADRGDLKHAAWHARRAAQAEGPSPETRSIALLLEGTLLDVQGDTEAAAEAYLASIEAAEHDQTVPTAQARYALGCALRALGATAEAVRQLDLAVEECEEDAEGGGDRDQLVGRCLNMRGLVKEDAGDYDEGAADYERAAALFGAFGDRKRFFKARANLAASELKRGRQRLGIRAYRDLKAEVDLWGYPGLSAAARNNLGLALMQEGLTAEAEVEYREAVSILGVGNGKSSVIAWLGLGDALERQGIEGFDEVYDVALQAGTRAGHETRLRAIEAWLGRRCDRPHDEHVDRIAQEGMDLASRQGDLGAMLRIARNQAHRALARDDSATAEAVLNRVLAAARSRDFDGHVLALTRVRLAGVLAGLPGRRQGAFDNLWDAALAVEARMARTLLDERLSEIVDEAQLIYGALIELLAEPGNIRLPDARDRVTLAFDLHESARSRSFAAALANNEIPAPPGLDPTLVAQEQTLLARERALQNHEQVPPDYRKGLRGSSEPDRRTRLEELREVRTALEGVWARMRDAAPDYVRLRTGHPISANELRLFVAEHDPGVPVAVASFFVTDNATLVFLLDPSGELRLTQSPVGRGVLADAATRLGETFNGAPGRFPPVRAVNRDQPGRRSITFLTDLARHLVAFADALPADTLILLAPHGPLHALPLHALPTTAGPALGELHPVVHVPSLSTLPFLAARPKAAPGVARRALVTGVAAAEDQHPERFEGDETLVPDGWVVDRLSEEQASRTSILSAIGSYDVVHLTCHGYFDARDPMRSGLLVGNGSGRPTRELHQLSRTRSHELVVSARDLAASRMDAELVTLRACSAGASGELNRGDEFGGLVRSLLYAGAAGVVAPLWNVDQRSSRQLVEMMYEGLASGQPVWLALQQAQRRLVEAGEDALQHPYHWAPLVYVGDWR